MQKRVVIVCGAGLVSGKEIMCLVLARGLRELGWTVEFITSNWSSKDFRSRLEQEKFGFYLLRLGFIAASLRWRPLMMTLDQMQFWPNLLFRYARLMRKLKPAVVIHTNWHHALLLAPLLDSKRDIYWSHEILPNFLQYRVAFRRIASRVAQIVCVSRAAANSLQELLVDPAKTRVIYNGILTAAVAPERAFCWPLRLGIVGQIGPWKGHDDVFEALFMLARPASEVTLKIYGKENTPYSDALKKKAVDLGIAEQIEWYGFVEDQSEIYSQIDVCLITSRAPESFGMTALEAALHSRPVIATAVGGLVEIVIDGQTGFLLPCGRPDLLAQAIGTVLCNPEMLAPMGRAANKRVRAEFSHGKFLSQFAGLLEGVRMDTAELIQ